MSTREYRESWLAPDLVLDKDAIERIFRSQRNKENEFDDFVAKLLHGSQPQVEALIFSWLGDGFADQHRLKQRARARLLCRDDVTKIWRLSDYGNVLAQTENGYLQFLDTVDAETFLDALQTCAENGTIGLRDTAMLLLQAREADDVRTLAIGTGDLDASIASMTGTHATGSTNKHAKLKLFREQHPFYRSLSLDHTDAGLEAYLDDIGRLCSDLELDDSVALVRESFIGYQAIKSWVSAMQLREQPATRLAQGLSFAQQSLRDTPRSMPYSRKRPYEHDMEYSTDSMTRSIKRPRRESWLGARGALQHTPRHFTDALSSKHPSPTVGTQPVQHRRPLSVELSNGAKIRESESLGDGHAESEQRQLGNTSALTADASNLNGISVDDHSRLQFVEIPESPLAIADEDQESARHVLGSAETAAQDSFMMTRHNEKAGPFMSALMLTNGDISSESSEGEATPVPESNMKLPKETDGTRYLDLAINSQLEAATETMQSSSDSADEPRTEEDEEAEEEEDEDNRSSDSAHSTWSQRNRSEHDSLTLDAEPDQFTAEKAMSHTPTSSRISRVALASEYMDDDDSDESVQDRESDVDATDSAGDTSSDLEDIPGKHAVIPSPLNNGLAHAEGLQTVAENSASSSTNMSNAELVETVESKPAQTLKLQEAETGAAAEPASESTPSSDVEDDTLSPNKAIRALDNAANDDSTDTEESDTSSSDDEDQPGGLRRTTRITVPVNTSTKAPMFEDHTNGHAADSSSASDGSDVEANSAMSPPNYVPVVQHRQARKAPPLNKIFRTVLKSRAQGEEEDNSETSSSESSEEESEDERNDSLEAQQQAQRRLALARPFQKFPVQNTDISSPAESSAPDEQQVMNNSAADSDVDSDEQTTYRDGDDDAINAATSSAPDEDDENSGASDSDASSAVSGASASFRASTRATPNGAREEPHNGGKDANSDNDDIAGPHKIISITDVGNEPNAPKNADSSTISAPQAQVINRKDKEQDRKGVRKQKAKDSKTEASVEHSKTAGSNSTVLKQPSNETTASLTQTRDGAPTKGVTSTIKRPKQTPIYPPSISSGSVAAKTNTGMKGSAAQASKRAKQSDVGKDTKSTSAAPKNKAQNAQAEQKSQATTATSVVKKPRGRPPGKKNQPAANKSAAVEATTVVSSSQT